jgi:hypothetical protein
LDVIGARGTAGPIGPLQRTIVKPGAPWWAPVLGSPLTVAGSARAQGAVLGGVFGFGLGGAILLTVAWPAPLLGLLMIVGLLTVMVLGLRAAPKYVVSAERPKVGSAVLSGDAIELLGDIENRFDYGRRLISEIPTGITWSEIAPHVQALLWDAAEHAGRLAELDDEIRELRYASRGTPQAALKSTLNERRLEHEQTMRAIQWQAEDLAKYAGNAAAAARLALARTGDSGLLEIVAPSAPTIQARDALAEVKERLAMLSQVWSELDPRGAALSEALAQDAERELPS